MGQDVKIHSKPLLDKVPELEKKICLLEMLMQEKDRKLEQLGKKLGKQEIEMEMKVKQLSSETHRLDLDMRVLQGKLCGLVTVQVPSR